jgi:hypothetical protein
VVLVEDETDLLLFPLLRGRGCHGVSVMVMRSEAKEYDLIRRLQ